MLWNVGTLLTLAQGYRIVVIEGRFGGGKTALAYRLAVEMLKTGNFRYLLGNTPCVACDDVDDVVWRLPDGLVSVDAVGVVDEAGGFIKRTKDVEQFLQALRKLNVLLFFPSVFPVPSMLRKISVRRLMDWTVVGVPLWVYEWRLYDGLRVEQSDKFFWWFPHEIFGFYDTLAMPYDFEALNRLLDTAAKALSPAQASQDAGSRANGGMVQVVGASRSDTVVGDVRDIEIAVEAVASVLDALPKGKRQSGRR